MSQIESSVKGAASYAGKTVGRAKHYAVDSFGRARRAATWCPPLAIYVVIAVIGIIMMLTKPATAVEHAKRVAVSLLWTLFWSYLMYVSCDNGMTGLAWILLLLPIIVWAVMSIAMYFGLVKVSGKCEWSVGGRKVCLNAASKQDCDEVLGVFTPDVRC